MDSNFSIEFRGDYLHVSLTPDFEITSEGMETLWIILANDCKTYKCSRVLLEGTSPVCKVNKQEAYVSGAQALLIPNLQLAALLHEYFPDETSEFFKLVISRGGLMEFFTDRTKALNWLGVKNAA